MKLTKRFAAAALTAVMTAGMLSGCSQLEEKADSEITAATFGDTKIMLDEVLYYVRSAQYSYEMYFGSDICSSDMGDGTGRTVGDYIKEDVLTKIRQTQVLNEYAAQEGITLTDSQKTLAEEARDRYLEGNAEYAAAVGATTELVEKEIFENALANAVYLKLVEDVDTTVGDDEFLRKKIAYVRLTPSELTETTAATVTEGETAAESESQETGSEDASEEISSVSESVSEQEETSEQESSTEAPAEQTSEAESAEQETTEGISQQEAERQEAMEAAAEEILEKFQNGEKAADFIDNYKENSYFTATNSEVSISEDGTAAYVKDAWALETDACTVYNSEDGSIYIIRCLNDNDEEARQSAIDSEIQSRKSALFAEKYAEIEKASSKFKVNEKVMETIRFTTPVYVAPTQEETSTENASVEEEVSTEAASAEEEVSTEAASAEEEVSTEAASAEEVSTEAASAEEETSGTAA